MAGKGKRKRPGKERRERRRKEREKEPAPGEEAPSPEPAEPPQVPLEKVEAPPPVAEPAEESISLQGIPEGLEAGEEAGAGEEARLRRGLLRSRKVLSRPFTKAATKRAIEPEFWLEAEEALIAADAGVACASEMVENARKRILSDGIRDMEGLKGAFRSEVVAMIRSFGSPPDPPAERPRVVFVVGVNGVGKTTTAAKIGYRMKHQGHKVMFAAADTFRAAGIEQMEMWAYRVGAPVVRHKTGGDPAAVAFDAVESAIARSIDVVLIDTAGRLHTKKNLMEELAKMWRVADRQMAGGPEAVLVIDATTGQNGVNQARVFGEALDVSSIALTKMDGSAKGGVVLAIGRELGIPVAYIGVGEGLADLRPFDATEYAKALF